MGGRAEGSNAITEELWQEAGVLLLGGGVQFVTTCWFLLPPPAATNEPERRYEVGVYEY